MFRIGREDLMLISKMKRLEDIIYYKMDTAFEYLAKKVIEPDMKFKSVTDIDKKMLDRIKQDYDIEAIVLDVDETLRSHSKAIPKRNGEWIKMLKGQIKVIILSNGIDRDVEAYFRELGIDYIGFAMKPFKKNFINACKKLGVRPEKTLMIGNNIIDDIWGGNRSNMKTALVNDFDDER